MRRRLAHDVAAVLDEQRRLPIFFANITASERSQIDVAPGGIEQALARQLWKMTSPRPPVVA